MWRILTLIVLLSVLAPNVHYYFQFIADCNYLLTIYTGNELESRYYQYMEQRLASQFDDFQKTYTVSVSASYGVYSTPQAFRRNTPAESICEGIIDQFVFSDCFKSLTAAIPIESNFAHNTVVVGNKRSVELRIIDVTTKSCESGANGTAEITRFTTRMQQLLQHSSIFYFPVTHHTKLYNVQTPTNLIGFNSSNTVAALQSILADNKYVYTSVNEQRNILPILLYIPCNKAVTSNASGDHQPFRFEFDGETFLFSTLEVNNTDLSSYISNDFSTDCKSSHVWNANLLHWFDQLHSVMLRKLHLPRIVVTNMNADITATTNNSNETLLLTALLNRCVQLQLLLGHVQQQLHVFLSLLSLTSSDNTPTDTHRSTDKIAKYLTIAKSVALLPKTTQQLVVQLAAAMRSLPQFDSMSCTSDFYTCNGLTNSKSSTENTSDLTVGTFHTFDDTYHNLRTVWQHLHAWNTNSESATSIATNKDTKSGTSNNKNNNSFSYSKGTTLVPLLSIEENFALFAPYWIPVAIPVLKYFRALRRK